MSLRHGGSVRLCVFICITATTTTTIPVPCHGVTPHTQERFEYIRSQLLPFLKSVGFKEQAVQWLPAVGPAGQNLKEPPTEPLLSSWWKGPTLVQAIDTFVPKPRNTGGCAVCTSCRNSSRATPSLLACLPAPGYSDKVVQPGTDARRHK